MIFNSWWLGRER